MDNKIKKLKTIRKICIIPFAILLIIAVFNSLFGVGAFIGSTYYGIEAFLLTIIAFLSLYWWIGVLCIIVIITTSIIIKKNT